MKTQRTFTFDQWQRIMDALPPEQAGLELDILEECEDNENGDAIVVEMTEDEATLIDEINQSFGS